MNDLIFFLCDQRTPECRGHCGEKCYYTSNRQAVRNRRWVGTLPIAQEDLEKYFERKGVGQRRAWWEKDE